MSSDPRTDRELLEDVEHFVKRLLESLIGDARTASVVGSRQLYRAALAAQLAKEEEGD